MELNRKRRDFMRNAALAAAATFTPGMTIAQKADAVEDELERRLMLAQGMGGGGAGRTSSDAGTAHHHGFHAAALL